MMADTQANEPTACSPTLSASVNAATPATLQRRLESRFVLVQVLDRCAGGEWLQRYWAGAEADLVVHRPERSAGERVAPLNWLSMPDALRVAEALEEVTRSGRVWQGQVAMTGFGATLRWIEVEIHPEITDESRNRVTVIGRDLGRERSIQSEADEFRERVKAAQTAAEFGIIEFDTFDQTVRLDEAAAALHGLPNQQVHALPLVSWAALLVPEDQRHAQALLNAPVTAGQTERLTVRLVGPDPRKPRLLELSLRTAPGRDSLVGACRDVTRERSLEALRRQKLAAERASQAKSEFMSHVSHELRTPLNAILGFAQLMTMDQREPLAKAHRERLEMVQHSGQRLLGLIDQLLQITRIERGKAALQSKSVNVRVVVRHSIDTLELLALERGVDIAIDIDRPELSAVRADPAALEQVLTNLLSNAIKYNRDGGRVRISFRAGEMGQIVVDDTGKGMSESQLGRMFEPFDRLDADKTTVPGTGLGLVITRQLIVAMGGTLEVWSQVGKGSRFKIELPLARGSRDTTSNTLPLEFPSQWDTGREHSVLYIEDDEVNVVLMEQLFATQPAWQLRCATTGAEGIVAAIRQSPQLILLDMNLPDMQGVDVFKRLSADPRTAGIPCVAVSADALPAHVTRVNALGFEDYWTKPLDLAATVGKLKRLLR